MNEHTSDKGIILWQKDDSETQPQALLIESYSDTIIVSQDGDRIYVSYDSVDEFIKVIRRAKNAKP